MFAGEAWRHVSTTFCGGHPASSDPVCARFSVQHIQAFRHHWEDLLCEAESYKCPEMPSQELAIVSGRGSNHPTSPTQAYSTIKMKHPRCGILHTIPVLLLAFASLGQGFTALHRPRSSDSQCFVTDAWPVGPGSTLVPQVPDAELQSILSEIDTNRIETIINKLVSFGTRHTLSTQTDPNRGIGAARDWIASEMRGFAANAIKGTNVTITVPSYIQQPASGISFAVNISNIIATIQGTENSKRTYIITGHYDSRVTDLMNFTDDAPGADDDGSGVAIVMELVRILARRGPPKATIMLGAVAGEEQGLYGSAFFAQQMVQAGADVQGMFTNDIVGASKADNGVIDANSIRLFAQGIPSSEDSAQIANRVSIGGENDSPARQLARFTNEVASNSVTDMKGQSTLVSLSTEAHSSS